MPRRPQWFALALACAAGCAPGRGAQVFDDAADLRAPEDQRAAAPPDLGYACGAYSAYRAQTEGIVRSQCDFDVSRVLSIGGDVKTRIRPPSIEMEFPDGTTFSGSSDGLSFVATRTQAFRFTDGCDWRAVETLRGQIDLGGACALLGTYTYRESPTSPPPCATPCTVDADVRIERRAILIE